MSNLIQKLFIGGDWKIGFKRRNDDTFSIINNPDGCWCADPFIYEDDGKHYIFCELYMINRGRGGIGYFEIIDDKPVYKGILIEQEYHMSYPCIFKHNGTYCMIPETSANSTIDIYCAEQFPNKWYKKKTLLENVKYVDSTVIDTKDGYLLLGYTQMGSDWELTVFQLDIESMQLHPYSKKRFERNIGRPAGNFFEHNGILYRPSQDCGNKYGEKMYINQVDSFNKNGEYLEHTVDTINLQKLALNDTRAQRIHTYNTNEKYEVIDVFKEKIELLKTYRILKRSW